MEHQAFFSETNLEVLCKVAASTFPANRPFDAASSTDRQRLYEVMHSVFTGTDDEAAPLSALNKQVLRRMLVGVTADADRATAPPVGVVPPSLQTASPPTSPVVVRRGSTSAVGIRDLDTHTRPVPTTFQARPQQTSIAAFDGGEGESNGRGHDFQSQLQAYESTRAADTPADRVDPVDFALDAETDTLDGDEATRRMEALMAAREAVGKDVEGAGAGTVEDADPGERQTGLAAAMERFDAQAIKVDDEIEAEQARQNTQRQTDERAFRATQVYKNDVDEEAVNAPAAEAETTAEVEGEADTEVLPAEDLVTSGAYWLDETVRLNLDTNGRPKLDQCAFQDALQLTREERALNETLRVQAPTLHEHLLLAPPKEYVTTTHFLEVSSSDRVRTLNITETPYDFTVYFGTTMPAWRTYPVWLNNPIEYDTEEPETAEIRRSLGLRGLPLDGGYTQNIVKTTDPDFVEVQIPSHNQTNVDTVFKNVVSIKVHCVQIYFSYDEITKRSTCAKFPYLLLEIKDFANVYKSTNNAIRKSFCKLYYDASNCPLTVESKHHEYIPKYSDGITFVTPLASIDRLQFRLLDPTGALVSTAQDTYFVKDISIASPLITVTLYHHIPENTVVEGDHVRFKDFEWYAKSEWNTWVLTNDRVLAQIERYDNVQTEYTNALKTATTNEDRRKLRAQFEKDQVEFDYPTLGYPTNADLASIKACLERPEGHRIEEHKVHPELNTVTIQIPFTFDPETGDSTQVLPAVPVQYTLMNGVMLHESHSTNISLTVVERDVAPTIETMNS